MTFRHYFENILLAPVEILKLSVDSRHNWLCLPLLFFVEHLIIGASQTFPRPSFCFLYFSAKFCHIQSKNLNSADLSVAANAEIVKSSRNIPNILFIIYQCPNCGEEKFFIL